MHPGYPERVGSGITFDKLVLIAVLGLILIGPDKLPSYAKRLGEWARQLRGFVDGARDRLKDEMGPDFDDVDWKQLDPRQYDPRRIIREALQDPTTTVAPARESAYAQRQRMLKEGRPAPFDPEAT